MLKAPYDEVWFLLYAKRFQFDLHLENFQAIPEPLHFVGKKTVVEAPGHAENMRYCSMISMSFIIIIIFF